MKKVQQKPDFFALHPDKQSVVQTRLLRRPLKVCLIGINTIYTGRNTRKSVQKSLQTRAIIGKVMKVGYYWTRALKDAKEFFRKYAKSQLLAHLPHCPPKELTLIISPWTFSQWGVDIVGPYPK